MIHEVAITGASSGIGRALALDLSKKLPTALFLLMGRNRKALEEVAAEIGERATVFTGDLSTREAQQEAAALIQKDVPDLLINAAGLAYYGPALSHTLEEELEVVEVNVTALQILTLAAAKALEKKGRSGTIVNISSAAGFFSFPGCATYAAAKAFVTRFSQALDFELRHTGIRVLTTCLGQVATPFSKRASKGKSLGTHRHAVMPQKKVVKAIWNQIETGRGLMTYDWRYNLAVKLVPFIPKSWLSHYLERRVS